MTLNIYEIIFLTLNVIKSDFEDYNRSYFN